MVSFLTPATGGIQPINGRAGSIVKDLAEAKRGVPGQDIIPHPINKIIAATQIALAQPSCDPETATQRTAAQVQKTIIEIIYNAIEDTIKGTLETSVEVQQILKKLEPLEALQELSTSQLQEMELLNKDLDVQRKAATIAAISAVSRAAPTAAQAANAAMGASNIKLIAGVAAHLEAPVGVAINLGRYGGVGEAITVEAIEVVSQACTFG
ncbi:MULTISPECIES: hypothetical protein [unclassified Microcoleus]|uniref:hypothetical protein n=1 Tax=unclassified Microcoleus TaxID=2642155 RepID=UPI002FCE8575